MYHLFGESADKISLLRKLDHASIYFLIAGTFAPFCLVLINNVLGWSVFASVCILAIIGACLSFIKSLWSLPRWLLTSFYVFIGLIGIILIYPLRIYPEIIKWIIIGGAFYLIGAIIYTIKKPNLSKAFGFHELFHLFILGGTFSHFFCIYQFIALN
jgi:hemolysin III